MWNYDYPAICSLISDSEKKDFLYGFIKKGFFKNFYILEWTGNDIKATEINIDEAIKLINREKTIQIFSKYNELETELIYNYVENDKKGSFTIQFNNLLELDMGVDEIISEYIRFVMASYEIIKPPFVRTVSEGLEGHPIKKEIEMKKLVMFHWIQILSPEMIDEKTKKKIMRLKKLYKVEELPDGALYVQLTKYPDFIDELRYVDKKLKLECPEELKYW